MEILLIRGIIAKNPSVLYNMEIILGKNRYKIRALVYQNLFNKTIRINFKKSLLVSSPEITIYLSMLRENHEIELGLFKPNLKNFEKEGNVVYKIIKANFPVGTVSIEGKVTYYIKAAEI